MSIEFTNNCNFSCVLCPHAYYKKKSPGGNIFSREKGYLDVRLLEKVIYDVGQYTDSLSIGFFGEPLLHPQFSEMLESLPQKRDYMVTLNSNWSLFTKHHAKALRNVDSVRISMDTTSPHLYDTLCPGSDVLTLDGKKSLHRLETVEEKLAWWLDLDDRPETRVVAIKSSFNKEDWSRLPLKWSPHLKGEDILLLKPVVSYGGCIVDSGTGIQPCDIYKRPWLSISWDGKVSPCNLDVDMAMGTGDLRTKETLADILESEAWKKNLERIQNKQGICANCHDGNNWTDCDVYRSDGS